MQFSTMITAPSTIRPKSSAPRLIRLALTLFWTIPVMRMSIDSGITAAVMSAARQLPSSASSTTTTSSAPSKRLVATVLMVRSTSIVRSYTVSAITPSGRERLTSSSFAATRCDTVRLFSPNSMNTVPSTDLLAVLSRRAGAQLLAQQHFGNVLDADRHALLVTHHDVLDLLERGHLPRCANQVLLAALLDVARTHVGVVGLQRLHHVVEAQAVSRPAWRDRA